MNIAVFDRLLHPSLLGGTPEQVRLARTTAAFVGTSWIFGPLFIPIMLAVGDYISAISCAVSAVLVTVPVVLLRRYARRDLTAHMVLAMTVIGLVPSVAMQGGIHGPALDWLVVVPLLATLLLSRRGPLVWLGITLAVVAGYGVAAFVGVQFPAESSGIDADMRLVASGMATPVCVYLLARAFEWNKTRMAAELEHARTEAESARSLAETARVLAEDARHEVQRVLDTVDQGLFTIAPDGQVGTGISAAALRWFGAPPPGATAWAWLHEIDADAAAWLELGWDAHRDGILPPELTIAQLPQRVQHAGRSYALRWLATDCEGELLAVVTDVTEVVEAERAERAQREVVAVLIRLIQDRQGIVEFLEEADDIVHALAVAADPLDDARAVHTLKGNAGLFGLSSFAACCHEVENSMAEHLGVLQLAERHSLIGHWHELRARIDPFLGRDPRGVVQVARARVERLLEAVTERQPYQDIEHELRRWTFEPTRTRLERIAEQARGLAARLDKGEIDVHVEDNGVMLSPSAWAGFWSSFTHAIRNAVDHGLESPEQRYELGKPERGAIWLRTAFEGEELVVAIRDDGRGIDWRMLAERALARGLPCDSHEELQRALLTDGVTTARVVGAVSGRGIGMAAVQQATLELHGRVVMRSRAGLGTTFEFRFPASAAGGDTGELVRAA